MKEGRPKKEQEHKIRGEAPIYKTEQSRLLRYTYTVEQIMLLAVITQQYLRSENWVHINTNITRIFKLK